MSVLTISQQTFVDLTDRSIVSVEVKYAKNDSSSNPPMSGWSVEVPAWENGKYIWSRIETIYSFGDPDITDPVCITGSDGNTQYLHIKYSNDGQTFTENNGEDIGNYIGIYIDSIEADSDSFEAYDWKKITGEKGEDGKNIIALKEQYCLHNSDVNPPDNNAFWSYNVPNIGDENVNRNAIVGEAVVGYAIVGQQNGDADDLNSQQYCWMRYEILWDDGSITYTDSVRGLLWEQTKQISYTTVELNTLSDSIVSSVSKIEGRYVELDNNIKNQNSENAKTIEELRSKVEATMDSESINLAISNALTNGVNTVETSTGYRFDKDGLTINKTGSATQTFIDENGMKVQESGTDVLTANNNGCYARNLEATTYLIIGKNSRFEDWENDNGNRTACFWIRQEG